MLSRAANVVKGYDTKNEKVEAWWKPKILQNCFCEENYWTDDLKMHY
jgi:hypothetical protein